MIERILCMAILLGGCSCGDDTPEVDASQDAPRDVVQQDDGDTRAEDAARDEGAAAPSLAAPATLTYDVGEEADVLALALSPDGARLAAAGWDGRVVVFDLSDGSPREIASFGTGSAVREGAMAWIGERIAVGRFEGLVLLDPSGAEIATLTGSTRGLTTDGNAFIHVSASALERVDASGAVLASTPVAGAINVVAAGAELFVLTEVDAVYSVRVFDGTSLASLRELPIDARGLYGSEGGILAGTVLNRTTLYDTDGAQLRTLPSVGSDPAGLSLSGEWAAHLGFSEGIALFDVQRGVLLAEAAGATGRGIVLDGQRRIFAGGAGGVLLYEIVRE